MILQNAFYAIVRVAILISGSSSLRFEVERLQGMGPSWAEHLEKALRKRNEYMHQYVGETGVQFETFKD